MKRTSQGVQKNIDDMSLDELGNFFRIEIKLHAEKACNENMGPEWLIPKIYNANKALSELHKGNENIKMNFNKEQEKLKADFDRKVEQLKEEFGGKIDLIKFDATKQREQLRKNSIIIFRKEFNFVPEIEENQIGDKTPEN
jgi:hypothetical protein